MKIGIEKGLLAACLGALALVAAGCPAQDECGGCQDGETCDAASKACVSDKCVGKTCPAGLGCNPADGACGDLCAVLGTTCEAPATCNPATGQCVDKCAGVTCKATELCEPADGKCKLKCKSTTETYGGQRCGSDSSCDATSGECLKRCESNTKPRGQAECESGFKCKATSGQCVPLCDGIVCSYGGYCNEADGKCVPTGQPVPGRAGSACGADTDCTVANPAAGQEAQCVTNFRDVITFEGGYCMATCSPTQTQCPSGSKCLPGVGCLDTCAKDADCRSPGYRCQPLDENFYACFPVEACDKENPADCGTIGSNCEDSTDCVTGASCIPEKRLDQETGEENFTGFEGGYCAWAMRGTDKCPAGSTAVPLSESDQNYVYCLKTCRVGSLGANGCGLGESCLRASQTDANAGVCWFGSCAEDSACQTALCLPTNTQGCGKGQECNVPADAEVGTCKVADTCTSNADCEQGTPCVAGECFKSFCEPSLSRCLPDCTLDDGICPSGTTCNATSKRCERGCATDANCGASAYCKVTTAGQAGVCVGRCTANNEKDVCGTNVCNLTTGRCQPKCTEDANCGEGSYCGAGGRCAKRCDAPTDPVECPAEQSCDTTSGRCKERCTVETELDACGLGKFCRVSTGECVADCRNASVCGGEACAVHVEESLSFGRCGESCVSDANCGTGLTPESYRVKCLAGANAKRFCQRVACADASPCAGGDQCVEGFCKKP